MRNRTSPKDLFAAARLRGCEARMKRFLTPSMKEVIRVCRGAPPHKWRATFPDGKTVSFGLRGYSDYTIHKDPERMMRYLRRHVRRENWSPSGRFKSGFWSRWLLWSKPSLRGAARETERILGGKYRVVIAK